MAGTSGTASFAAIRGASPSARFKTFRDVRAELGEQTPDHVHELRALLDQKVARPVQRQGSLLVGGLHCHEAHDRTRHRFADRFGAHRIVLAPLHIGLHVGRWHQTNLVAELRQLASPIMRGTTRLHADETRPQLCKKRQHLASTQRLAHDDLIRCVDRVNLKDVLGQIKADSGNLHGGWLLGLGFA